MSRRGQAIIEYLVVAMALIAIVFGLSGRVRDAAMAVMDRARVQAQTPSATADSIIPRL